MAVDPFHRGAARRCPPQSDGKAEGPVMKRTTAGRPGPFPSDGRPEPAPANRPVPPPSRPQASRPSPRPALRTDATRTAGPLTAVWAGLALFTGGILLALERAGWVGLGADAAPVALAAAAAVLGAGIIQAGLAGRRAQALGVMGIVALASAALAGLLSPLGAGRADPAASWAPSAPEALQGGYSIAGGSGEVDLRGLGDDAPLASELDLRVSAAASTVNIILPEDIPVRVISNTAFGGAVRSAGGGPGGDPDSRLYNPGAPGETLVLDVRGVLSTITITSAGNGDS